MTVYTPPQGRSPMIARLERWTPGERYTAAAEIVVGCVFSSLLLWAIGEGAR